MDLENKVKVVKGYRLVLGYLGSITIIIGLIILLPLLVIPFYPSEIKYALNFLIPGLSSIFVGLLLSLLIYKKQKARLQRNQDSLIVVGCWIISFIVCCFPFLLKQDGETYNFTQSMFEVVSGFTTTGLSVVDVEIAPNIYLMYRSLLLLFGGAGLILVLLSIFSDSYGLALYNAEGHEDRLLPNLIKSARTIMLIYFLYIVVGSVAYVLCGMPVFDAINHSIAAVATGGFSTKADSIGYYNSVGIEIITIVLMLLGSTNFFAHLYLLRGKFKNFFRYNEVKTMLVTLAIFVPIFTIIMNVSNATKDLGFMWNFRNSAFHIVSALTGTGFQLNSMDVFVDLAPYFLIVLLVMMVIGGNTGSTSGGIKSYRLGIIVRNVKWKITETLRMGSSLKTVHYVYRLDGREYIDDKKIANVHSFVLVYLMLMMIGSIIFAVADPNATFTAAIFEFSSALGTVGLSMGIISHAANPVILWTAIVGMFLGRLEIYIIIIFFIRLGLDSKAGLKRVCHKKARKRQILKANSEAM